MLLLRVVIQAQSIAAQSDKRQRQFDKSIDEWKRKVTDLQACAIPALNLFISSCVFTARCYACAVLAMGLCLCLSVSVTSRSSTRRLNVGLHKENHTIAQGL